MTAPADAQVVFDAPEGGYAWGDPVTATITATSVNTTQVTRNFSATVEDATSSEDTPVTGQYMVNLPDQLDVTNASGDGPSAWTAGIVTQRGPAFTATYTTPAG